MAMDQLGVVGQNVSGCLAKMKALVLTSDGLRHAYFSEVVGRAFETPFAVIQKKKDYYTNQESLSTSVASHLERLREAEKKWFNQNGPGQAPEKLEVQDINSPEIISWAEQQKFEVVCLFGTAILKDGWLSAFPGRIVNLHLGLSPFYRGSATLFWPFVNQELHLLGTTIHLASAKVDAGDIIERVDADLLPGEDYYAITNRLIRDSIDCFADATKAYLLGQKSPSSQERIQGKYYRKADFNEKALFSVLDYVQSGLSPQEIERIKKHRACRF